jgi:hypothetical protein
VTRLVGVATLWFGACCAAAPAGAAWPASAGRTGDVDRDAPEAWREDGGTSVEPDDPATSAMVEQARLGPPPSPPDDEVIWGEVDGDLDDSADLDGDVEITFDPDEMIFDL